MTTATGKVVMDDDALHRTLVRIAHEIVEKNPEPSDVVPRRHLHPWACALAQRLRARIAGVDRGGGTDSARSTSPSTATT